MPRKAVPAKGQKVKQAASQVLQPSRSALHPGSQQQHCKPSNASRELDTSKMELYEPILFNTSDLYPDMRFVTATKAQYENCCKHLSVYVYKAGAAKEEYRNLYASLIKTDRVSLKDRNDSGDLQAAKQWQKFCEATVKLLILRLVLFKKSVQASKVGDRFGLPAIRHPRLADMISMDAGQYSYEESEIGDKEIKEFGKLLYSQVDAQGDKGTVHSDDLGDQSFVLDLSSWVVKGGSITTSNPVMKAWMAMMKMAYGNNMSAILTTYQILSDQIRDLDEEQLANQAEAGITEEANDRYFEFCVHCFQTVVLWQMLYNRPIPIRLRSPGVSSRKPVIALASSRTA